MPGDELGLCRCGHRHAMCHRVNAAKYCPPSDELMAVTRERDGLKQSIEDAAMCLAVVRGLGEKAEAALAEAHDFYCGCDEPGNPSICNAHEAFPRTS